jgi:hypothetical protein
MEVDDHDFGPSASLFDELLDDDERVHGDVEEEVALEIENGNGRAVGGLHDREARSGAAEVRRPDHSVASLQDG